MFTVLSVISADSTSNLTVWSGRRRGRLNWFCLRKGDSGPEVDSDTLTKGSICDVLANVPSLSRFLVTLRKGDGGEGGTKSTGSKTLSLSDSDAIEDSENNFDLSKGFDKLTVRELLSQSNDAVDSVESNCLSRDSLASGDIVMTEGAWD